MNSTIWTPITRRRHSRAGLGYASDLTDAEWRRHYNTERPHSALGYRPPAPEVLLPMLPWLGRGLEPTGSGQGGMILAH